MKNKGYIGLLLVFAVAVTASADVLLQDGFETATLGGNPVTPPWTTTETYPTNVEIVNTYVHSGNQSLQLKSAGGSVLGAFTASEKVSASLWTYTPSINTSYRTLNIMLKSSTATVAVNLSFNKDLAGNWGLGYYASSTFNKICDAVFDTWANLTIYADAGTDKWYLEYNGVTYNNGGSLYDNYQWVNDLGQFAMSFSQNSRQCYVDDVLVSSIPEPATLGVLTLGFMAAMIKRKRSK